jgi:hypothetical protein
MTLQTTVSAALAALLLAGGVAFAVTSSPADDDSPLPALPAGAVVAPASVVSATPFVLIEPSVHFWSAEQPAFDAGLVLVLRVEDTDLLVRRQTAEPVLYVGEIPAERVNGGAGSGHVIAIVPSARTASGGVALAGTEAPVFLGDPALPEEVDLAAARSQVDQARAAGVTPSTLGAEGAEPLTFPDHRELLAWTSNLVASHAPDEQDLVSGLLAPRLTR